MRTFGQELEYLQNIIDKVRDNQSYKYDGREYTRGDLKVLESSKDRAFKNLLKYGDVTPLQASNGTGAFNVEFS